MHALNDMMRRNYEDTLLLLLLSMEKFGGYVQARNTNIKGGKKGKSSVKKVTTLKGIRNPIYLEILVHGSQENMLEGKRDYSRRPTALHESAKTAASCRCYKDNPALRNRPTFYPSI